VLPRRAFVVRWPPGAGPPSTAPLAPALAADALASLAGPDAALPALLAARGGGVLTVWRAATGAVVARAALGGDDGAGVALSRLGGDRGGVRVACASARGVAVVDVGE
jgi:hypothetical protein